jgi:mono/diheme cytochrome c family protein
MGTLRTTLARASAGALVLLASRAMAAPPAAPVAAGPAPSAAAGPAPSAVDFTAQILPLFQRACSDCHGPKKASGGLQLTTSTRIGRGGITGPLFVAGKPDKSYIVDRLLGRGGEDRMPQKGEPLAPAEIELVRRWIAEGSAMPADPPVRFRPAPGGLKRLTRGQYLNTLRALFGEQLELPTELEPDTLVSGSAAVGAARVVVSLRGTEKYAAAAFALARRALGDSAFRARFVGCAPDAPFTATCAGELLERFGLRAWRRPLTADERARYVELGERAAAEAAKPERGRAGPALIAITAALLQSPNFLYRVELGEPDPVDPSRRRLTDHELASRLSYFLWAAPPDEELLADAAAGRLGTEAGLAAAAERMLRAPRSRETMRGFFAELFRLAKLDRLAEYRAKYKQVTDTLPASMRGETMRVIEEIAFAPDRDFREIFAARFTYVNAELARLYGLPEPAAGDGEGFARVALPAGSTRPGVLGQGSFLSVQSHPTGPSPTKRGKFIREALLCQPVPPPPPEVNTKLPKDPDGAPPRTTRAKLAAHRTSPKCAGCHKAMDPLGLAFETYDGIGVYRDHEGAERIDPSGELDGVAFKDAGELGTLLSRSPKVAACMARSLLRFALGHLESEDEQPLIDELTAGLARDGYRFQSLVLAVVKSQGFRTISPAE